MIDLNRFNVQGGFRSQELNGPIAANNTVCVNVPAVATDNCTTGTCEVGPTVSTLLDPNQFRQADGCLSTIFLNVTSLTTTYLVLGGPSARYRSNAGILSTGQVAAEVAPNSDQWGSGEDSFISFLDETYRTDPTLVCQILVTADTNATASAQFNQRARTFSIDRNSDSCFVSGRTISCGYCDNNNGQPLVRQYGGCVFPLDELHGIVIPISPATEAIPSKNLIIEIYYASAGVARAYTPC